MVDETVQRLRAANSDAEIRGVFAKPAASSLIYCIIWRQLVLNSENADPNVLPFKGPQYTAQIIEKQTLKAQMQVSFTKG